MILCAECNKTFDQAAGVGCECHPWTVFCSDLCRLEFHDNEDADLKQRGEEEWRNQYWNQD